MVEITPMAGNQLQSLAKIFFQGLNASTGESLQGFNNIVHKLFCSFVTIVVSAIKFAGLVVMCLLYGWYGFDPRWIAAGLDVNQRFTILEKHWAYFVGFGIPYVLLVRNTTFFWGYGVFLAVFPFCILLGALSDYTKPYTENREADMPLPFFQLAKSFSLSMLKFVKTDQPRQKMSLDSGKKQKSAKAKHKKLN